MGNFIPHDTLQHFFVIEFWHDNKCHLKAKLLANV